MTFYAPLSSVPCRECVPSTCVCEPDEVLVSCEDCMTLFAEDEITECGACAQTICDACSDANGVCCRDASEPDEDWFSYLPCHGG
jgi:hypothetical protein